MARKILTGLLFLAAFVSCAFAQNAAKWKTSGVITWGYNQTAANDSWTGKESFARSWQIGVSLDADRKSDTTDWLSSFLGRYGESQAGDGSAILPDILELETVYIYKIYKYLQPYGSFYLRTQNNVFWDPVTYMESAGLSFTVFDNKLHTLKVRGGGALMQVDNSMLGNFRQSGAEATANYTLKYAQTLQFSSEAKVFETFSSGEDLYWKNRLLLKTGPWFTTEIGYMVYFDGTRIPAHNWPHDIETLTYVSLGVSFNLF